MGSVHVSHGIKPSYVVVSAAFSCDAYAGASEMHCVQYQHLSGSGLSMWWYQRLWCIVGMLMPVRCVVLASHWIEPSHVLVSAASVNQESTDTSETY